MDSKLKDLLINEEQSRFNQNYSECLSICRKILNVLQNSKAKEQIIFDTISKILFKKNQSNFVRIGLIFHIIRNNYMNIFDNKNLKYKYYQLLIESFKYDQINDKSEVKQNLISLFESSNNNNFKNLDSYILSLDVIYISEKSNSSDGCILGNSNMNKNMEIKFNEEKNDLEEGLIHDESQQNEITQIGLVDNINKGGLDLNSDIQVISGINDRNRNNADQAWKKKYKVNNKLPMIVLSISVNLNTKDFLKLIQDNFTKLNYKHISNVRNTLYDSINIYEYSTNNILKKIAYCLFSEKAFVKNVFQVGVVLQKDENNFTNGLNYFLNDNNERKLSIKTIKGNEKNIISFILKYLKAIACYMNKIKIIKQSKSLYKYDLEKILNELIQIKKNHLLKSVNIPKKKNIFPEEDSLVEKSNKKVNRYYEIYKILSNVEYELGKSLSDFVSNFRDKYKDLNTEKDKEKIEKINTVEIMIEIIKIIEYTTNNLNCNYNNDNINYNSNFYNSATEQFIFNKIYNYLYQIYNQKYKKCNEEFLLVKKDINENIQIKDIITSINIKKKYITNEPIPFKPVIENINKIPLEKCLKNKFKILTQCSLEIRNCILEYTGGKSELESMDDELPIIIYLVTQINVENLFAELNMIDDYIKCTMRDELVQNKMVTNLLSSLNYVSDKWNKDKKNFDD